MSSIPPHLNEVIEQIYKASLDSDEWSKTLQLLAAYFKSDQGILRAVNTRSREVFFTHDFNKETSWDKRYEQHYKQIDPWIDIFNNHQGSFYACSNQIISDREYEKTEFHAGFIAPQGGHYGIGGLIKFNNLHDIFFVLNRPRHKLGFEPEDVSNIKMLAPHINQAMLISQKTQEVNFEKHLLLEALDQINSPVLLVDENASVLFANSQAENLLETNDSLSIQKNILRFADTNLNIKLNQLIVAATDNSTISSIKQGGAMCAADIHQNTNLCLLVNPVNSTNVNNDTGVSEFAMIFLSDNINRDLISEELLADLYQLSSAESKLVKDLCAGFSLDQIALKNTMSRNTLKTQLRSCFGKTGVDRQADLISLVNTGPLGQAKVNI